MYTEVTIEAKLTEESEESVGLVVTTDINMTENLEFRTDFIEAVEETILAVIQKYNEVYNIGDDEVHVGGEHVEA